MFHFLNCRLTISRRKYRLLSIRAKSEDPETTGSADSAEMLAELRLSRFLSVFSD